MKPELLYVGIGGAVVALNPVNGQQVWCTQLKGSEFVNVQVKGEKVLATTLGEIFCLDAATGEGLWHNLLKGMGRGLAAIAFPGSALSGNETAISEKSRQDTAAASAVVVT